MSMELDGRSVADTYCGILDFLSESSNDYFYFMDFQTERIHFSRNICRNYDVMENGRDYVTVHEWSRIVYSWDLPILRELYEKVRSGRETVHRLEYRVINRRGDVVWISSRGKSQLDGEGRPQWAIGCISEGAMDSGADNFTGAFGMNRLKQECGRLLAEERDGFLLLVGVDDLKSINLKMGRGHGNAVLRRVVEALESAVDGERRIYRTNGDCFAVNLPETDARQAEAVFSCARNLLEGQCTLSGGCVPFREYMVPDAETLYQYAENTLDHAKAQGKNRLLFFSADDYEKEIATLELKEDLTGSVQAGFRGFSLCYQPQVCSGTYRLYGAEALLRYTSPRRGSVPPSEFVPILEQSGLIRPVGIWVLDTALEQCRIWRQLEPDFHVSINVSYTQLCEADIVQKVLDAVDRSGLPGEAVTLEITESMQLLDYPQINDLFLQWKKHGIEISVDDFGTGYSSLSRLKELEIDEIKIDRCFVNNIQHSAYNYRLLGNMLELADSCQIRVCCEGVETEEELTALEELHPALLQGFLFSRPCTPAELEERYLRPDSPDYRARLERERNYLSQIHVSEIGSAADWSEDELAAAILEAENDIFYISDMDTYELYYVNPAGRRMMGLRDYRGRKCYKALQGLDEPCPFCTNAVLKRDNFYIWDRQNEYCGRHFLLKDKIITYQGRRLRMEVALDITKHEVVSRTTQERLIFAQKIAGYTRTLSEYADYGEAVNRMLASVGEFYQADRAYLFEPSPQREGHWDNTFEWCAPNVEAQAQNLQDVPPSVLERWMGLFDKDCSVVILNLDTLRRESPEEWRVLEAQGISRLIAVPVRDRDQTIGFIGVDNPRYSIHDDAQIRVLSSFLLGRIRQERNESRYRQLLRANCHDIFELLGLGLWAIRFDREGKRREMVANDTMLHILGISGVPSAEECYQFWYSRINDGYRRYVDESMKTMIRSPRPVQLEYSWRHPERGDVLVRCTGMRMPDEDGMICLKGYHRIVNDMERPKLVPDSCARDIFEYNAAEKTIFFHTERTLLLGEEAHESNFPQCWIDSEIVHPHFVEAFRNGFSRTRLQRGNERQELLLKSKNGTYEWFKLTTQRLDREQKGQDAVIAVLEPIGADRVMELEYMRMRKFYHTLLSEAIAYAEVDLESGQLKSVGGLWRVYKQDYRQSSRHFIEVLEQQLAPMLAPEDLERLSRYRDPEVWNGMLARGETSSRFSYRRPVGDSLHWVELTIYLFREDITRNVYTLIYLKDVNAEKEREFAQAKAADRDPLTGLYNRTAFEREMKRCVEECGQSPCGVLLMMDIDDFKQINDQKGHLEGDKALQAVARVLTSTFRQEDIVGRLGGDEFLVFIRGGIRRERLEQRVETLLTTLSRTSGPAVTGSIGLTYVCNLDFRYDHYLKRADLALYESKRRGKNRFHFYEDSGGQD
ncbi:EAL domain-containing protein [Pseudoflavonifractor sp. CLA-AP-H29]|uniref:EAL domain-containing protein n=1 Tax=Pseudoflavonifractor intestinihominis TaxID=3133171 RepID=A0ABV1EBG0_9FIRM